MFRLALHRWQFLILIGANIAISTVAICQEEDEVVPLQVVPVEDVEAEITEAALLPGADSLKDAFDDEFQVWVDRLIFRAENPYSNSPDRYLLAHVVLLNRTNQPIVIESEKITCSAFRGTFNISSASERSSILAIRIGDVRKDPDEFKTPPHMTVPAGRAGSFWCLFTGLPVRKGIQEMELNIPIENGTTIKHDLRREQRARLGLEIQRIGPKESLALLSIHGSLNSINAQDLAEQINQSYAQQTKRFVIHWTKSAQRVHVDLIDWLLHRSQGPARNPLYAQYPDFHLVKFLALANIPKQNQKEAFDDDQRKSLYETDQDAVQAALSDLFKVIDPKYLTTEIRQGHPLSQRAALASLALRHDYADLEGLFAQLTQLYDNADEQTRRYVLLGIGQQTHPEAIPMLVKILEQESPTDAEAAMLALLRSNQRDARVQMLELLENGSVNVPKARQMQLLAENFRRQWQPILQTGLDDRDPEVRAASLAGLVSVGHPDLSKFLIQGLSDDSEKVQNVAFDALVQLSDPSSELAAVEYALEILGSGVLNDSVTTILQRTRDQRAASLIVELIKQKSDSSLELLALLQEVGDETNIRDLLLDVEMLPTAERIQLCQLVVAFDMPEKVEVAKQALHAEDPELRRAGLAILSQQVNDDAVQAIYEMLPSDDEKESVQICYALGRIGTEKSLHYLKEIRSQAYQEKNSTMLDAAKDGVRLWLTHSAGWNAIETAYYHSQADNYENALTYFELACEIDPELGVAFSGKGNTLLKLQRYDDAKIAFEKAYEVDDFDGQAVTGIGIIQAMQGEPEKAVQFTVDAAGKFPEDNIFAYNTACVYGRAIEFIRKHPEQKQLQAKVAEYERLGLQSLKLSIEYGFDEFELMSTDPDIATLRELPAFKELRSN